MKLTLTIALIAVVLFAGRGVFAGKDGGTMNKKSTAKVKSDDKVMKTNEEWKAILTPEQYSVTRMKGTERPFSGKYNHFKKDGVFTCVCCGAELFSSKAKFDSGTH